LKRQPRGRHALSSKTVGLIRVKMVPTFGTKRIASDMEYSLGLFAKLLEEAGEVVRAPKDVSEYADLLQVLIDLAANNGIGLAQIEEERVRKEESLGGFYPGYVWQNNVK
jgi:predicted house-cleaning noncanonical NTP pyrophosphatase (MazG superfamily)